MTNALNNLSISKIFFGILLTSILNIQNAFAQMPINEKSISNYFAVMESLEKIEGKYPQLQKMLKKESIFKNSGKDVAEKMSSSAAKNDIEKALKQHSFTSINEYTNFASRLMPAYLASKGNLETKKKMLDAQKSSLAKQSDLLKQSGAPQSMIDELNQSIEHYEQVFVYAEKATPSDIAATKVHAILLSNYFESD